MNNMNINIYKHFYEKGVWDESFLHMLQSKGMISQTDLDFIKTKQLSVMDDTRFVKNYYNYEVWDKKTPINGVPAEQYIEENNLQYAKDIILFKKGGRVELAGDVEVLKTNNDIQFDLEAVEVGDLLTKKLNADLDKPEMDFETFRLGADVYQSVHTIDTLEQIKTLLMDIKQILLNK